MSSIKDMLKSKIKSRTEQPQTMESFDENAVKVTVTQGKTQLSQIKLQCTWNNSKNNMKTPKLMCKWYNRTQNNIQQINGVEDEIYQPSLMDVGSIIEVTCIPQLPGINYEGMPIVLKTNTISLSSETENEVNQLLNMGKAKFFIELKDLRIKGKNNTHGSESMIRIDGNKLIICQMKFGHLNDEILKEQIISEDYPQIVLNRKMHRQITIKFNSQESCVINFKNHQMRDVFCLLNKLMVAKMGSEKTVVEKVQQPLQLASETVQVQTNKLDQKQVQQQKKQQVIKQQHKEEVKIVETPPKMPEVKIKQSTSQLLQIGNLKQQIKKLQIYNSQITKQLQIEKQKVYSLSNKIDELNERLQSASNNYFKIQRELTNAKQESSKFQDQLGSIKKMDNNKNQEVLYYKNQIKIMEREQSKLSLLVQSLQRKEQSTNIELAKFKSKFKESEVLKSYSELEEELNSFKEITNSLKLKFEYSIEEKEKMEEDLKNSRNLIEQIQCQKKYIQKKYESLANQIGSPSLAISKLSDNRSGEDSLSNSFVFEEPPASLNRGQSTCSVNLSNISDYDSRREKQLIDLKRQLRDLIEENTYIRGIISKQKKSSSKTQLKLQLFQVKKIANRLSEAMIQKDSVISNLKQINKQVNKRNNILQSQVHRLRQQQKQ